jgi:ribokinase
VNGRRRVAVVGHVEWVDFVPVASFPASGEVIHSTGAFAHAAGGGSVAAAVLAELGAEVDFFCALGDDELGRAAAAELGERGINLQVAWRAQPTRRALTLLEPGGERTIVTIGERLQPRGADELDWERLRGADGVYVTAGDAEALRRARAARVVVLSPRAKSALEAEGTEFEAIVFSAGDADERDWAAWVADRARLFVATEGRLPRRTLGRRARGPLGGGSAAGRDSRCLRVRRLVRRGFHLWLGRWVQRARRGGARGAPRSAVPHPRRRSLTRGAQKTGCSR